MGWGCRTPACSTSGARSDGPRRRCWSPTVPEGSGDRDRNRQALGRGGANHALEYLDELGIELSSCAFAELGKRRLRLAFRRVGPLRGDRVVGVADENDPGGKRD